MINYEEARKYWIAARTKRGVSLAKAARAMTAQVGYAIDVYQLGNFEYKGTRPNAELWKGLEWQMREWKREDGEADGRVREERDAYGADHECAICASRVPGPLSAARYCLYCGSYFNFRVCRGCGFQEYRLDAEFCSKCGIKFEVKEAKDV